MRRTALILAASLSLLAPGRPALAHTCSNPVRLEPGQVGNVTVGLPSEDKPVTEFVVHMPEEFEIKAARAATGGPQWTFAQEGRTLRYTGGPLRPFSCLYLSVAGVVARPMRVVVPLTVKHADGTIREYDRPDTGDQYAAQVVYVGIDPPGATPQTVPEEPDAVAVPVPALAGLAAAGAAAWWLVKRRHRTARTR